MGMSCDECKHRSSIYLNTVYIWVQERGNKYANWKKNWRKNEKPQAQTIGTTANCRHRMWLGDGQLVVREGNWGRRFSVFSFLFFLWIFYLIILITISPLFEIVKNVVKHPFVLRSDALERFGPWLQLSLRLNAYLWMLNCGNAQHYHTGCRANSL